MVLWNQNQRGFAFYSTVNNKYMSLVFIQWKLLPNQEVNKIYLSNLHICINLLLHLGEVVNCVCKA